MTSLSYSTDDQQCKDQSKKRYVRQVYNTCNISDNIKNYLIRLIITGGHR